MKKLIDMLFIKNIEIKKDIFLTLYFSYDDLSFVGFNKNSISVLKKYDNYEIIKKRDTEIGEKHHEIKYIIKTIDKMYFIRTLSDYRNLIYDILIYTVKDLNKINNIFFPEIEKIPDELIKLNKIIIKKEEDVKLVYNHSMFTNLLGYEDWDYKNKCLNKLDYSCTDDNFINLFNKTDFKGNFKFVTNSGIIKELYISFKYIKDYYIIDEIR